MKIFFEIPKYFRLQWQIRYLFDFFFHEIRFSQQKRRPTTLWKHLFRFGKPIFKKWWGGGAFQKGVIISVSLWVTNSLHLDHQNKAFRHSLKASVTTVWRLPCEHEIGEASDILLRTYKGIAKQFSLVCERERERENARIDFNETLHVGFWASNLGRVRYAS